MDKVIYFDNAATTFPKPEKVYSFMDAFYRRCGFEVSERPYLQPPYRRGEQPVPLVLMTTDAVWLEKHHEEVVRVLAERVYGVKRLDACCKSE